MGTEDHNSGNINYHSEPEPPRLSQVNEIEEISEGTHGDLRRWRDAVAIVREPYLQGLQRARKDKLLRGKARLVVFTAKRNTRIIEAAEDSGILKFLGFQDVVPLNSGNVLGAKNRTSLNTPPECEAIWKSYSAPPSPVLRASSSEHGFGWTISNCNDLQNSTFASSSGSGRSRSFTTISRTTYNLITATDTAFGLPFNCQETSSRADVRIDILDGDDHNQRGTTGMQDVYSRATNSSFASSSGCYELICNVCSGPHFNRSETSSGADVRIEILDGDDRNQRGTTGMPDVYSRATDYSFASSSSCYELTCDVCSGPHFNRQETSEGAEVPHVSFKMHKDDDDHLALPIMPNVCPPETKFQAKFNSIILGITGQAAVAMVSSSSSSSDSPFLRIFAAATGIGFLGSFFANYILKKPKIARILSKIGAIGAVSAVIFALGSYFPEDTKWKLNMVASVAACLISAVVVASS
ncbi:hypothetical protein ACH5RR_036023 [Cinchona calisaya]|uniref:Uncharacterized protein n=1 Tax=Cinchona calisaya TaxID=153742 RepID=A0ABD2Y6T4_9GENT